MSASRGTVLASVGVGLALFFGAAAVAYPGAPQTPGDPEKGQAAFEKCGACHSVDGSKKTTGPTLLGVFGRTAASLEDYRYSSAMTRSAVVWDRETMDLFLAAPQGYIRGNRMAFAGIEDAAERSDLIAYLEEATKPAEAP